MREIWKPIPGHPGYEVSNLGKVRSYCAKGRGKRLLDVPHILKPAISKNGYHGVGLGEGQFKRVHYLVLLAFVGPRPEGLNALHNDDDKSNNRLDNLRYGTQQDNMDDMIKNHNGKHPMKKYSVKKAPSGNMKRDEFIEIYNSCHSIEEACIKTGRKKDTVFQVASRLRKLGYELKYFERGKGKYMGKKVELTKAKRIEVLLALEAGEITEGQAARVIGIEDRLDLRSMRLEAISAGIKQVITQEPSEELSRLAVSYGGGDNGK